MFGLKRQPQRISAEGNTLVQIDGANFYSTHKQLGFTPDYKLLKEEITSLYSVQSMRYYTAEPANTEEFNPLRKQMDWMGYNGFNLVKKPMREYDNGEGQRRLKGNMDVEITVDCIMMAHRIEKLVLFTGDGDFCYMVKQVQQIGVHVTVISSAIGKSPICSNELRRTCDDFIEVAEMQEFIAYKG